MTFLLSSISDEHVKDKLLKSLTGAVGIDTILFIYLLLFFFSQIECFRFVMYKDKQ